MRFYKYKVTIEGSKGIEDKIVWIPANEIEAAEQAMELKLELDPFFLGCELVGMRDY